MRFDEKRIACWPMESRLLPGSKKLNLTWYVPLPGGKRRLREAILYVSKHCEQSHYFGLVKLNKIIWRADFKAFLERARPVTGVRYQRLQYGPAPWESGFMIGDMQAAGIIDLELHRIIDFDERRPIIVREFPIRFLAESDTPYLDESIAHYWEMTGRETSDDSHGVAWRTRDDGDPMPYEAAFLSNRPLNEKMRKVLEEKGRVLQWHTW